jgi:hypothetical protein
MSSKVALLHPYPGLLQGVPLEHDSDSAFQYRKCSVAFALHNYYALQGERVGMAPTGDARK